MANERHVEILLRDLLRDGVVIWNTWRIEEPEIRPDLSGADLSGADLRGADLRGADLRGADLSGARLDEADFSMANLRGVNLSVANLSGVDLRGVDLGGADLSGADLRRAHISGANLRRVNLRGAYLPEADLSGTNLSGADLRMAILSGTNLSGADLSEARLRVAHLNEADLSWARLYGARLRGANLQGANLSWAHLNGADLSGADLSKTTCVGANFSHANLSDCTIYGISAWNVNLDGATQTNLRITPYEEPAIKVDNLEVAQFLYLLIHNQKIRDVLDTITSKVVLILGRFGDHKPILDGLREALRSHPNGYIPVLFDFGPQADRAILDTVKTLASLARFVIADLTDARAVRAELMLIVPTSPNLPVQPIMQRDAELPEVEYTWLQGFRSVLPVYRYMDLEGLLANLTESVIEPVEQHVQARRISGGHSS